MDYPVMRDELFLRDTLLSRSQAGLEWIVLKRMLIQACLQ
jgi:hypothetical protein